MTNRTVQIMGAGFGSTPATVTATLNGSQVFSGTVETLDIPIPFLPADANVVAQTKLLFTFEIPMDLTGAQTMTCTVANTTVVFAQINANYANRGNMVGNTVTYTSGGPSEYDIISAAPRQNVQIDGVPQDSPEDAGCGWWVVYPESTLSYDLIVLPGLE